MTDKQCIALMAMIYLQQRGAALPDQELNQPRIESAVEYARHVFEEAKFQEVHEEPPVYVPTVPQREERREKEANA